MKKIFLLLMFTGLLSSCSNELLENNSDTENIAAETRATYNGSYFDWDRIDKIPYKTNTSSGELVLPWAQGSTQTAGIPSSWIDQNFESKKTSDRYYAREKGWNLVYSNLLESSEINKFFTLYNEKTGILRFFFNTVVGQFNLGTTNTFVTFNIPSTTSLLNFYTTIAEPINLPKTNPSTATSIISTFDPNNGTMTGTGFMSDVWYGLEIECAYDPSLSNNYGTFNTKLYSSNVTVTKGSAETTGTITGTITGLAQNSTNITLSNMFNGESTSVNNSFTVNNTLNIASTLGKTIDVGVAKKDNFFTGLWSKLKSGITSGTQTGAQAGIKAIFNGGASAAASALKGMLTSFLGGGADNSISKVELDLKAVTTIKTTSESQINGWMINSAPLPGTKSSSTPLYNKLLGVWNLSENPSVTVDIDNYSSIPQTLDGTYTTCSYSVSRPQVVVNPASNMSIKNVSWTLILKDNSTFTNMVYLQPFTILNGTNYREAGTGISVTEYGSRGSLMFAEVRLNNARPYVYVSLELADKVTGKSYFYGKYFHTGKLKQGRVRNFVDNKWGSGHGSSGGGHFEPQGL